MHAPLETPVSTRHWLLQHVCPYWHDRIVDPRGGFFEGLDAHGQALPSAEKTVLNQARLTYVFSHAAVLAGPKGDVRFREAAAHGFAFLERMVDSTGAGQGWPRRVDAQGQVLDATRDTYDQAFVLFAMAWYHRASASPLALDWAEQIYGFLDTRLADRAHGGFFEEHPAVNRLPRRQNPHMHLLEALLALHTATGHTVWIERAHPLIALFQTVFYDRSHGALAEYFDMDWALATGAAGDVREPGHQFEWTWLLQQYLQQAPHAPEPNALKQQALRLFDFGQRHGLEASGPLAGMAVDAVLADGSALTTSKLLWPQTEYIKACVARFAWTQDLVDKARAQQHMAAMRHHFFKADGANWTNHLAPDGSPLVQDTPARVLYHLFLAAEELVRTEEL